MTVKELWDVSPKCHIFIRTDDGVKEYSLKKRESDGVIESIYATEYPMYKHVLEVKLVKGK